MNSFSAQKFNTSSAWATSWQEVADDVKKLSELRAKGIVIPKFPKVKWNTPTAFAQRGLRAAGSNQAAIIADDADLNAADADVDVSSGKSGCFWMD